MKPAPAPMPRAAAVPFAVGTNPFSRGAVLAIVLLGSALFVALLWMIATGTGFDNTNDGGAHVGGRGLNGYAAVADYLERRGFVVSQSRNRGGLDRPGLLVLTPPASADGRRIASIVGARRYIGPTLVITPKWLATPPNRAQGKQAKTGWVRLDTTVGVQWAGFLDEVSVAFVKPARGRAAGWIGADLAGPLPDRRVVLTGAGTRLTRIVATRDERYTLAGYMDDGGRYPGLEAIARDRVLHSGELDPGTSGRRLYPVVIVFDPDLLDNYGMADLANARLAEALVRASGVKPGEPVSFDLTLNGFDRAQNLLALAFTPPFLAATLCLLLAAAIVGWRAFLRFGPPLAADRTIAYGKRALVANAAGLIRRSRRLHLIAGPYADRARDRLVGALALPRTLDPAQADAAIDRALARRDGEAEPFSHVTARLRAARGVPDLIKAARDLHALERMLTR